MSGKKEKADILNRIIAKGIDVVISAFLIKILPEIGTFAGIFYILIADGFNGGKSAGKGLIGLKTVFSSSYPDETGEEEIEEIYGEEEKFEKDAEEGEIKPEIEEERAATFRESMVRNSLIAVSVYFLFGIGGFFKLFSAVIIIFELLLILGNKKGQRLGDIFARTLVVEAR